MCCRQPYPYRITEGLSVIRPRSRIALSNLWETQHDFRRITCDCLATLVQTSNDFGQPPYLYLRDSVRGHYLRLNTSLSPSSERTRFERFSCHHCTHFSGESKDRLVVFFSQSMAAFLRHRIS